MWRKIRKRSGRAAFTALPEQKEAAA